MKKIPLLKYYSVFHISQCEGMRPRLVASDVPHSELEPDDRAEQIIADYVKRSGVTLRMERSDRAFYRPSTDTIVIPDMGQFVDVAEYYSTLFHETVHSTGHPSRLNRITDTAMFGSESYSKEELTAELGSAYLMNTVGLESPASFCNSAAYIQGWLSALKNDKRFIVSAASKAEKATQLILNADH